LKDHRLSIFITLQVDCYILKNKNNKVKIIDLGISPFLNSWKYQDELFDSIISLKVSNRKTKIKALTNNYMIFVEHPAVYTLGNSGKIENLLVDKNILNEKNIEFYKTNRGGDITFHGPGQIVCYPILDLDNFFTDIHKYLRFLEEIVIETLNDYGIKGQSRNGETGVWVKNKKSNFFKICAIGVKASRWVTMHGFALNVNTDLNYFKNIIPCGIKDKGVTSMKNELGKVLDKDLVKDKIQYYFSKKFEVEFTYWGISYKIKLSFSDLTTSSRFLSLSIFDISTLEFP